MKTNLMMFAAIGALAMTGACRSAEPPASYANPVEACAGEETQLERDRCMKNVVADVAASVKRESERKAPPPQ